MRASAIEFRLRLPIMVVVISLGFWSPWIEGWGSWNGFGQRVSLLEWLALVLSRLGLVSFSIATPLVIVAGALLAALGAVLRVWGTAYLGSFTVVHGQMRAGTVLADGPYRYVRNPLYLGSWCMVAAMAFCMPPTGALLTMVFLTIFLLRLILGEEAFLSGRLGEPYQIYLRTVPRLIARLRTTLPSVGGKPRWLESVLSELNPIGVFITLAVFSWSYNNRLMVKAVIVSFGLSLVARALLPEIEQ